LADSLPGTDKEVVKREFKSCVLKAPAVATTIQVSNTIILARAATFVILTSMFEVYSLFFSPLQGG
jgi:hypothetical protein